jgi:hypothetical protein
MINASAAILMRSALFWDIMRRCVVIFTDVSGQRIGPNFAGQDSE